MKDIIILAMCNITLRAYCSQLVSLAEKNLPLVQIALENKDTE